MAGKKDAYANKFYGAVTESAANTLTFGEIQTNVSIMEKIAWVLHRLEWYIPKASFDLIVNTADMLDLALAGSSGITDLGLDEAAVIDRLSIGVREATAVGFQNWSQPLIRDFSMLPGGGLIVAPRPLYVAAVGTSLAGPATVQCRGYYSVVSLSADEYIELVDFYRIVR